MRARSFRSALLLLVISTGLVVLITIAIHPEDIELRGLNRRRTSGTRQPGDFLRFLEPSNRTRCNFHYNLPDKLVFEDEDVEFPPEQGENSEYRVLYNVLDGDVENDSLPQVTYATHATADFLLYISEILVSWNGPVSVSVFVPGRDGDVAVKTLTSLCRCLPEVSKLSVHFVFPRNNPPIVGRRIRRKSRTKSSQENHQNAPNYTQIQTSTSSPNNNDNNSSKYNTQTSFINSPKGADADENTNISSVIKFKAQTPKSKLIRQRSSSYTSLRKRKVIIRSVDFSQINYTSSFEDPKHPNSPSKVLPIYKKVNSNDKLIPLLNSKDLKEPKNPKYPKESKVSENPNDLTDSKASKDPIDPEYPKNSKDPEYPKDSKDPEYPKNSKDPEYPKDSKDPEYLKDSKDLKYPKNPEYPRNSKDLKYPKDPINPKNPEYSKDSKDPRDPKDFEYPNNPEYPRNSKDSKYPKDYKDPKNTKDVLTSHLSSFFTLSSSPKPFYSSSNSDKDKDFSPSNSSISSSFKPSVKSLNLLSSFLKHSIFSSHSLVASSTSTSSFSSSTDLSKNLPAHHFRQKSSVLSNVSRFGSENLSAHHFNHQKSSVLSEFSSSSPPFPRFASSSLSFSHFPSTSSLMLNSSKLFSKLLLRNSFMQTSSLSSLHPFSVLSSSLSKLPDSSSSSLTTSSSLLQLFPQNSFPVSSISTSSSSSLSSLSSSSSSSQLFPQKSFPVSSISTSTSSSSLDDDYYPSGLFFSSSASPFPFPSPLKENLNLNNSLSSKNEVCLPRSKINSNTIRKKNYLSYPVNVCRNTARYASTTRHVLVSDVELIPSEKLAENFLKMMESFEPESRYLRERSVFVLPVFEVDEREDIPRNKEEVKQMARFEKAVYFHRYVCSHCQRFPGLEKWFKAPGKVKPLTATKREFPYHRWEPIYIGTKDEPLYSELLSWEGKQDKMTQMLEMCLLSYTFFILDGAFLVHWPGIKKKKGSSGSWRAPFVANNSRQYAKIVRKLGKKYKRNPRCKL